MNLLTLHSAMLKHGALGMRALSPALLRKYFLSLRVLHVAVLLSLLGLTACPEKFPHHELADARLALAAAQEEGAQTASPEYFQGSHDQLLQAHQFILTEDYSKAKKAALQSFEFALRAGRKTAPEHLAQLRKEASSLLSEVEESDAPAVYPEDYQKVRASYDRAQAYEKKAQESAEEIASKAQTSKKKKALSKKEREKYRASLSMYRYASSYYKKAAQSSRAIQAKLQEDMLELEELLQSLHKQIEQAHTYGASQENIASLQEQWTSAHQKYQEQRLSEARQITGDLQKDLLALLGRLMPEYAAKLLDQAKKAISDAEEKEIEDEGLQEHLKTAREARDSAQRYLDDEKHLASIQESENAIALIKIIHEQHTKLLAERNLSLSASEPAEEDEAEENNKGEDEKEEKKGDTIEAMADGWKRYTVGNTKPADCLWCIASRPGVYNNGYLWRRIYQANSSQVQDPNLIYPGQVLFIPPKTGPIGAIPPWPPEETEEKEETEQPEETDSSAEAGNKNEDANEEADETEEPAPYQ